MKKSKKKSKLDILCEKEYNIKRNFNGINKLPVISDYSYYRARNIFEWELMDSLQKVIFSMKKDVRTSLFITIVQR